MTRPDWNTMKKVDESGICQDSQGFWFYGADQNMHGPYATRDEVMRQKAAYVRWIAQEQS